MIYQIFNELSDIHQVIEYYSRSGKIFTIKNKTPKKYDIMFNKSANSIVSIPILSEKDLEFSTYFFLDDFNVLYTIEELYRNVLISRFEQFKNNKFKYTKLLRRDIVAVFSKIDNAQSFAYNNKLKLNHRIRVIKCFTVDKDGKKNYFSTLGEALWDKNIPNSLEDIDKYSKLFNDPISVISPEKGVYCFLNNDSYKAVGWKADQKSITSIFNKASNNPERFRQHITSNYLEPIVKVTDFLMGEDQLYEKQNALCVFMPISENEDESPVGKHTLIGGEILISKSIADRHVYVYRSYYTSSFNEDIVDVGTVVNYGDVLAWDVEGEPSIVYDLKYTDAVVHAIDEMHSTYRIVLKIKAETSVARLISDYGIKGVTHPRENLGNIIINDEELPVEMVVGPNSMKSKSNGIRMAWLALKAAMNDEPIDFNILSEDEINEMTSDLKKVPWNYNGKTTMVYVGLVSYGVTDLAKDCKTDMINLSPETLKYMLLHYNEHLDSVVEILLNQYVSDESKWAFREMLQIRKEQPLNININASDKGFQNFLKSLYFDIGEAVGIKNNLNQLSSHRTTLGFLLSPSNKGFSISFKDNHIRFPSAKLINYHTDVVGDTIKYPDFMIYAQWVLFSLKQYYIGKYKESDVLKNVSMYHNAINASIFSKKSALPNVTSPVVIGGHLKQLISSYVPQGVTVVVDSFLEDKILKFKAIYRKHIYDIGVRNPVIWKFQFSPKEIWTLEEFKKYLSKRHINISDVILTDNLSGSVLRNVLDIMYDQSDTDGDLYPIAVLLDIDIQNHLNEYMKNPRKLNCYEESWIQDYIKGESKNESFQDIENKPFKYHTVTREWFAQAFADSAKAKMSVGMGTVDLWNFQAVVEFKYLEGIITYEEMEYLQFIYSRIVQDYIVRGIKHVSGGSSGYNIYKQGAANKYAIYEDLVNNMNIPQNIANMFIEILFNLKKEEIPRILSRLLSCGNYSVIAQYTAKLSALPACAYNSSYFSILKNYIPDIIDTYVGTENKDDDEILEIVEEEGIKEY